MTAGKLRILAYEDTPLGPLCLRRRELLASPGTVVTEVTLNHAFLMSSHNTVSERALADTALEMCSEPPSSVLVGGLGLGYTAAAALEHEGVSRVVVVELLPSVIDWLDAELFPLAGTLKADARFETVTGDVYARLLAPPAERFDTVLVDVDHAPDDRLADASAAFYTKAGLERVRRHLEPGGVLGVWSWELSTPLADALGEVFTEVRVEPVTYVNEIIGEEVTDWLFFARHTGA